MKRFLFFILHFAFLMTLSAQENNLGLFKGNTEVGDPKIKGSVVYNKETQEYTMEGSGINMWASSDQFNFLWKKIKGDFMITATIRFIGKGVNEHRKIGIIARNSLEANSKYADACVHGSILTSLQYREAEGGETKQVELSSYHPTEIMLERKGNVFTFCAATFGENYKTVSKEIALNDEVYAGLFICSHDETVKEKAVFSNVRIIIPPVAGYQPYRDFIGSHLEVMDVATGHRTILKTVPNSIQAPNWTRDGKYLIYNSSAGLLYKYDLSTGTVSELNTGVAKNNNNDHVISFDGKMLGISNHVGDKRISTIFTLPITGSDKPTQITNDSAHSYFHSWSPDGKKLIFTGQRNGIFDIYSIDVASRKETRLTDNPTLDDGPEYTPDGKWIYFNSVRTGTMKLWRMKPDGSSQEQITFDDYNDWFPHISPDGKWIVYIAFPKEINPSDHPFYQKVYLRLMPITGGVPKTIAYVFGGQGTINVPSWSPDSKRIAFVSNTDDK
ncbi:MAG: TolB family protein [Flavisolibacter sp.]